MTLKYDFDIFTEVPPPEPVQLRPRQAVRRRTGKKVAMFRDERTVAALWAADSEVQDLFLASGFGLNVYSSGAPDGHYPQADADDRKRVLASFSDELAGNRQVLTRHNWGDFSISDFLEYLSTAQPVSMHDLNADGTATSRELVPVMTVPEIYTPDDSKRNIPQLMTKVVFWGLFGITIGQYSGILF